MLNEKEYKMRTFWSRTMIWLFIVMFLSVPFSALTEAAPTRQATTLITAAFPGDSPILLRQAAFQAYNPDPQGAWGDVQHRRVPGGEVLRLAPSFKARPGPTLKIVLTASPAPTLKEIDAAPTLAKLDSLTGPQEYPVPADQAFGAVVIYNWQEGTVAAIAPLKPEPTCDTIPTRGNLARTPLETAPDTCLAIQTAADLNRTAAPPDNLDVGAYRLTVTGQVEKPLSLSYADLKQYPTTSQVLLLICSGVFADTAEWTGVPLSALMEQAGVKPDFKSVRFQSVDNYWGTLDRKEFKPEDIMIAYKVNGEDLPPAHGYPMRVAIRNVYGSKWVKWVSKVEFLDK